MSSENKSKIDLLMQLAAGPGEEQDQQSITEIITNGLSELADIHGWDIDAVEPGVDEEEGEFVKFTFRRSTSKIVVRYEMNTGQFIDCQIINQVLSASVMSQAFRQLGKES